MPKIKSAKLKNKTKVKVKCHEVKHDIISKLIPQFPHLVIKVFSYLTWKDILNLNNFPEWKSFLERDEITKILDQKIFDQSWLDPKSHTRFKLNQNLWKELRSREIVYWRRLENGNLIWIETGINQIRWLQNGKIVNGPVIEDDVNDDPTDYFIGNISHILVFYQRYRNRLIFYDMISNDFEDGFETFVPEESGSLRSYPSIVNAELIGVPQRDHLLKFDQKFMCWKRFKLPGIGHECNDHEEFGSVCDQYLIIPCRHSFVIVKDLVKITKYEMCLDEKSEDFCDLNSNCVFGFNHGKVVVLWPLEKSNSFSILVTLFHLESKSLMWSESFSVDDFKNQVALSKDFVVISRHVQSSLHVMIYNMKTKNLSEIPIPNQSVAIPKSIYILREKICVIVTSNSEDYNSVYVLSLYNPFGTLTHLPVNVTLSGRNYEDFGAIQVNQDQSGFIYQDGNDKLMKYYCIKNAF